MNCSKREDLYYICKLVFDLHKTPIYFLTNKGDLVFEISSNILHNPMYSSKEAILNELYKEQPPYTFPSLVETAFLENFFAIHLRLNDQISGNIIVGPVLYSRLSETSINGIVNDLQLKINKEEMIRYYRSLPVLNNMSFLNVSLVLYYMLYQKQLDIADILQKNMLIKKVEFEIEQPDVHISEQRQSTLTHIDPLAERKIFECIKQGKKEELIKNLRRLPESGELGVLSKTSHLRSEKNSAIAAITLATRSAIEGGVFPEIAYTISDLFIQKLEEIHKNEAIPPFLENALLEFAERVKNSTMQQHSKHINVCQNYIFTHLYGDITLNILAEIVTLNPSYLSSLFKKVNDIYETFYIRNFYITKFSRPKSFYKGI